MFAIGCLLILSNMATMQVICYNMFGFNNGHSTLNDLCTTGDIIVVEEHWLAPYHLDKLVNFHFSFAGYDWSAMCDKIQNGILSGRPFGGLGVLIRKSLGINVTVLEVMGNCRCVALKCTFPSGNVHLSAQILKKTVCMVASVHLSAQVLRKTVCMVVNPHDKTKIISTAFPQLVLAGQKLQFVDEFRYLGHILYAPLLRMIRTLNGK